MILAFFVAVIVVLSTSVNGQYTDWYDDYKLDFSYDVFASNGPYGWGNVEGTGEIGDYYVGSTPLYNQCDSTNRPSPIHLAESSSSSSSQSALCPDLHEPLTRQVDTSVDCSRDDVTFAITPYGLKAYFPTSDLTCLRPTLILSGRANPYVLMWLEIHARSEHVINGKRYDAEIQMVHAGTGQSTGQLMTVSVLVDATATQDNLEIEWLLQQWNAVADIEETDCSRRKDRHRSLRHDFAQYFQHGNFSSYPRREDKHFSTATNNTSIKNRNLQSTTSSCRTDRFGEGCEPLGPRHRMFPYNLWPGIWFYGYAGSLTAPPCSEVVQWRVMDDPLLISRRQYKLLTSLLRQSRDDYCVLDTATNPKGENRRPIQESDNEFFRAFYHCTPSDFGYFVYEPSLQ